MKETILITGGHGLIAQKLVKKLDKDYVVRLLTRNKKQENEFEWNVEKGIIDEKSLIGVNHIIHLAGASVAEKRWTKKRKQEIISSRVNSAKLILNSLKKNNLKINSFISASAVGFYGTETTEKIYTEKDNKGSDFLSNVVFLWEHAADQFLKQNIAKRVVKLRTGVVLSDKGGALAKMKKPINYYVGAILGSGKQYMPWIHIDDICSIYEFAVTSAKVRGVYNAAAPTSSSNEELTKEIAKILKKPLLLPNIPSFVIELIFGEAATILLKGSRVSSNKIIHEGFHFKHPNLRPALKNLLEK
jgi:uncharacterized protein (TIGR01777 family)